MVLPSERVPWVNKHDVCMYVCMYDNNETFQNNEKNLMAS